MIVSDSLPLWGRTDERERLLPADGWGQLKDFRPGVDIVDCGAARRLVRTEKPLVAERPRPVKRPAHRQPDRLIKA